MEILCGAKTKEKDCNGLGVIHNWFWVWIYIFKNKTETCNCRQNEMKLVSYGISKLQEKELIVHIVSTSLTIKYNKCCNIIGWRDSIYVCIYIYIWGILLLSDYWIYIHFRTI